MAIGDFIFMIIGILVLMGPFALIPICMWVYCMFKWTFETLFATIAISFALMQYIGPIS